MCGGQSGNETDTTLSSSVYPFAVLLMGPVDIRHSQGCTEAAVQTDAVYPTTRTQKRSCTVISSEKNIYDTSDRLQGRALCVQYWPSAESCMKAVLYRGADKSLPRPTSRCIFLMVRIFSLMLVLLYIYSTNIPPIMIISRIYETQNLLSL